MTIIKKFLDYNSINTYRCVVMHSIKLDKIEALQQNRCTIDWPNLWVPSRCDYKYRLFNRSKIRQLQIFNLSGKWNRYRDPIRAFDCERLFEHRYSNDRLRGYKTSDFRWGDVFRQLSRLFWWNSGLSFSVHLGGRRDLCFVKYDKIKTTKKIFFSFFLNRDPNRSPGENL
jgi:hypothetical protein